MKLMIDIPKKIHDQIKHDVEQEAWYDEDSTFDKVMRAIYNGTLKQGKWIKTENGTSKCSECGEIYLCGFDYCPWCGSYNGGNADESSN